MAEARIVLEAGVTNRRELLPFAYLVSLPLLFTSDRSHGCFRCFAYYRIFMQRDGRAQGKDDALEEYE
jgi:hypothetical protein